jgi:hypothetical protein
VKGYTEKLSRFRRWVNGSLGELTLEMVRTYIGSLQSADKWAGHPFTPTNGQRLSATSVADHVRVLKGFSTWLFEEGYIRAFCPDDPLPSPSIVITADYVGNIDKC